MLPFFLGFPTCLTAFFRSLYNLSFEILALRQQLGIRKRKILALDRRFTIEYLDF
jgi:hypothetical protein